MNYKFIKIIIEKKKKKNLTDNEKSFVLSPSN